MAYRIVEEMADGLQIGCAKRASPQISDFQGLSLARVRIEAS